MNVTRELPSYQCHDQVSALQIGHIVPTPRGVLLGFVDQGYAPHEVTEDWVNKHAPQPGGYLIVFTDGRQSYAPQATFEDAFAPVSW